MKIFKKKLRRHWGASLMAVAIIAALLAGLLPQNAVSALAAAESSGNTAGSYTGSLGNDASTRYAGRVWTDKTVYTGDAVFTGDAGYVTVNKGNADFLVAFSALATSRQISGQAQVPVDVVFVIDNSNSMDNLVGGSSVQSRLDATVDAVNASIGQIMESNENSRVAVVVYGLEAQTLLPLGRYTAMSDGNYIRVRTSGNQNNRSTTFTASGNNGLTMSSSQRGTNTHMGVDAGMDILAAAQDITSTVSGQQMKHVPALILLSDGASTAAGGGNWWNPSGTDGNGVNTNNSYALRAAMNAAYQKQQVNAHYGVEADSEYAMRVYTIGMGIEQLNQSDYYRAQMALDPGAHLNDNNSVARAISQAWEEYIGGGNPTLDDIFGYGGYTFRHPDTGDISSIAYNDGYYSAEDAEDVANVFDDITGSIISSRPQVPTRVNGDDPLQDGYITYMDPIGEYMEVNDVTTILYGGQVFTAKTTSTQGNTTSYVFEGQFNSPVYGSQNVSSILVTVSTAGDGMQTLTVRVPAGAIPMRINTVALDSNGAVLSNTSNRAYPLRVFYQVSLKEEIDRDTLEGVDEDYLEENLSADGEQVYFYSNLYSGNDQDGRTVGDATVEFAPALTNPFYFVQEDTPLYLDEGLTQPAGSYDSRETYYFEISYYNGIRLETAVVERSAELMDDYTKTEGGQLYLAAGAPRLGYLTDFIKDKEQDPTGTASASYYPTFVGDPQTGAFKVYLGNNGRLSLDAPASLTLSKTVTAAEGLTAPDADFTFDITIPARAGKTVTAVLKEAGEVDAERQLVFDAAGKTTTVLKDGQSLQIPNLEEGTKYEIVERDIPGGFTVTAPAANLAQGTVEGADVTVNFVNQYAVTPLEVDPSMDLGLSGTKTLTGRAFQNGDSFTFRIRPSQQTPGAPLPGGASGTATVTISPAGGNAEEFAFTDTITFTQPGEYRYILEEVNPNVETGGSGISGINYDTARYRLVVTVTDAGDGTLSQTHTLEKQAADSDDWSPVDNGEVDFVNVYSAESVNVAFQGNKTLAGKPLGEREFGFTISAGGSRTAGTGEFVNDPDHAGGSRGLERRDRSDPFRDHRVRPGGYRKRIPLYRAGESAHTGRQRYGDSFARSGAKR